MEDVEEDIQNNEYDKDPSKCASFEKITYTPDEIPKIPQGEKIDATKNQAIESIIINQELLLKNDNQETENVDDVPCNTEKEKNETYIPAAEMTNYNEESTNIVEKDLKANNKALKNRKRIVIDDSDSEAESNQEYLRDDALESGRQSPQSNLKPKKALIDSDSDDDGGKNVSPKQLSDEASTNKRRLAIYDSDSEDEIITPHNKSRCDEDELLNGISIDDNEGTIQKSKWSTLCDSESSEDESHKNIEDPGEFVPANEELPQQKKRKKPVKEKRAKNSDDSESLPNKMTGKEAAKQMKEILSESQRRVREKNVSLPYHKPKVHSIKEFLSRRPKLASAIQIPTRTPPSLAIKMSMEQLETVSEKLKERKEKLKEFYKSESESEDEHDKTYVPPDEEENLTATLNNQTNCDNDIQICNSGELNTDNQDMMETSVIENAEKNNIEMSNSLDNNKSNENIENNTFISSTESTALLQNNDIGEVNNTEINDETDCNYQVRVEEDSRNLENIINETEHSMESTDAEHKSLGAISEKITTETDSEKKLQSDSLEHIDTTENQNTLVETEDNASLLKNNLEIEKETETECYDFNLDDIGHSENLQDEKSNSNQERILEPPEINRKKFSFTDLDREIENYNEENQENIETDKSVSNLESIKEKLNTIQPRLSGNPGEIIELETGVTKPNEITKLMKRFVQHTAKKQQHKHKVELNIVTVETGGDIHKETVAMNIGDDDDLTIEEKPGARLQRLREELQNQMAQKKAELWQQKSKNIVGEMANSDETEGTKEGYESTNDDFLDDENEEDMTEDDTDDDLLEENDIDMTEKTKTKSAFVDDEAEDEDELDGNEGDDPDHEEKSDAELDGNEEDNPDIEEKSDSENKISQNDEPGQDTEDTIKSSEITETQPKKRKRILNVAEDDSDDDDGGYESFKNIPSHMKSTTIFDKKNLFSVSSDSQDDFIPPHQKPKTPVRQTSQFLTPVSFITGIQNLNSSKKYSPGNVIGPHNVPSPLKETDWSSNFQKKLFMDSIPDSQELAEFCAGKFGCSQDESDIEKDVFKIPQVSVNAVEVSKLEPEPDPNTQDLLNLCSGTFTGVSQTPMDGDASDTTKSTAQLVELNETEEIKTLGEDQDILISQLLDEEEMENFKKKFDSPVRHVEEPQEIIGGGVVDSDDDDNESTLAVKKKNRKRLQLSDDEDSDNSADDNAGEDDIDPQDDVDNVSVENIGYDSEENEYELASNAEETEVAAKPEKVKLTDFFDAEAELSESEWGSADEDEQDLDKFEQEEGDKEKFDDNKIRNEIERIHMRKVLDEDIREVKMLQELLLEDGEMHGTGRQRQFKWKNIDSMDVGDEVRPAEDDVYLDEEESEEQWRKKRHEREMFIKEKLKKKSEELEDLSSESSLLQLGKKVLERSQSVNSQSQPNTPPVIEPEKQDVIKQSFGLLTKRGSFLTREDQVLRRIAEYTKVTTVNVGTAKNSKNFVFQSVATETVSEVKKRKLGNDGTPVAIKKLRLSELSPALKKKPEKSDRVKRLFSNW